MTVIASIFGTRVHDPGGEQALWDAARRSVASGYTGPAETEPFVRARLDSLLADLTADFHGDAGLIAARRNLANAVLELRLVRDVASRVEAETSGAIRRMTVAQHEPDGPEEAHALADGARAKARCEAARVAARTAEQIAERANAEFRTLVGEVTDRVLVRARAAITSLYPYMAIVNGTRADRCLPPLAQLPQDLPEQLVRLATARVATFEQEGDR